MQCCMNTGDRWCYRAQWQCRLECLMPCGRRAAHGKEFLCKHLFLVTDCIMVWVFFVKHSWPHGDTSWDDMVKCSQLVSGTEWLLGNCWLLFTVSFVTGCIILWLFFDKHIGRPLHCIVWTQPLFGGAVCCMQGSWHINFTHQYNICDRLYHFMIVLCQTHW